MNRVRKAPTMKQVAEEAGVSMMTVSAVLRPEGKRDYPIAGGTRARVLAAARKLNYFPSAVAQGMRGRRINTIGVVLITPNARLQGDFYVCGILDGIVPVANAAGQNITLFTGQRWSNAADSLPVFCDGRTDGLIILSPSPDSDIVPALLEVDVPFVLVNGYSDDPRASSVGVDSAAPMEALVGKVIEAGHRRIALLSGRSTSGSTRQRYAGYQRALAARGLSEAPALVSFGAYSREFGEAQTQALLQFPPASRPTALCCGNDQIALGALRALNAAGISVPGEMAVTGFDDTPESATAIPPLTTVRLPVNEMGKRAAEILLASLDAEDRSVGIKEALPTEIVLRSSIAPPP